MCAAVLLISWRLRNVYPDDALIVLRYVTNLLAGEGWVYNVGEHVNATTSPLHTMTLTVLGAALGGDLLTAQTLAFALPTAATALMVHRVLRPCGRMPALLAAVLVAFGPNRYSTLGMESALLIALSVGTLLAYTSSHTRLASILLGLAILARPDAILLAVVMATDCLRRRAPREIVILGLGSALVVLPWAAYATCVFGSPFPNTLAIKLAQRHLFGEGQIFLLGAWRELIATDVRGVGLGPAALATILLLAVAVTAARWRTHRVPTLFLLWATAQFGAYASVDLPPYHWYYAPLLFGCILGLAVLFETLWNARRARVPQMGVATALASGILAVSFPEVVAPQPTLPHYRQAGAWIADNLPEHASLACADIGIVGYFAHPRTIIDMQGLATPGGAASIARGHTAWWFDSHRPDFILTHAIPWAAFEAPVVASSLFQSQYREVPLPGVRGLRLFARRTE